MISTRCQCLFMCNSGCNHLFSFIGLDYVGHEDILPYKTTEQLPIHNHLFEKFLALDNNTSKNMLSTKS